MTTSTFHNLRDFATPTAEQIVEALGGRRGRCRCPSHPDKHPSLDVKERDGKVLFICRAGCSQREVLDALRARGLWAQREASAYRPRPAPFRWEDHLAKESLGLPDCCLAGGCSHWDAFDAQYLLAHLRGNLRGAIAELVEKFKRMDKPVTLASLTEGLTLALEFGLAPAELDAETVNTMMVLEVEEAVK